MSNSTRKNKVDGGIHNNVILAHLAFCKMKFNLIYEADTDQFIVSIVTIDLNT